MTRRTTRPGLSLVEVLAATFIMGIGLISIFTLFPYGALSMARAFKDDRSAQAAAAADGHLKTYWRDRIVENNLGTRDQEGIFTALDDPNSDPPATVPPGRIPIPFQKAPPTVTDTRQLPLIQPTATDPSYPVFVDPMGWAARGGADRYWVAETVTPGYTGFIARRTLNDVRNNTSQALRTCAMLDSLSYDPAGRAADDQNQAAESTGATVQRELRYNWLWVLQRPINRERNTVHVTVVVFDKRQHLIAPPSAETTYTPQTAAVGSTLLQFNAGAASPPIRKGQWLLDATTVTRVVNSPLGGPPVFFSAIRNANFYRALSVTENTPGVVDVELATPLKPDSKTKFDPVLGNPVADAAANERRFVVLTGVADVLERNLFGPPDGSQ